MTVHETAHHLWKPQAKEEAQLEHHTPIEIEFRFNHLNRYRYLYSVWVMGMNVNVRTDLVLVTTFTLDSSKVFVSVFVDDITIVPTCPQQC